MSTDQTSQQAAPEAGDVETSEQGNAHFSTPMIPEVKEEVKTPDSPPEVPETMEPKQARKSDKAWQESREEANEAEASKGILMELAKQLNLVNTEEKEDNEITLESLAEMIKKQDEVRQRDMNHLKWLSNHPEVKNFQEDWDQILKDSNDPEGELYSLRNNYDLLLSIVKSKVKTDSTKNLHTELLHQQVKQANSVPVMQSGTPSNANTVDAETLRIAKMMGNNPENFQKLGL
jgi:hypothetical protein